MDLKYPAVCFHHIANLSQHAMGGTSGALYGILLTSAAKFLYSADTIDWAVIWNLSLDTLSIYSKAKVGDRTMVRAYLK